MGRCNYNTRAIDAEAENTRFVPVVFSSDDSKHIPVILKSATYYNLDIKEAYDDLYARLTYQRRISKPAIGELRYLFPRMAPHLEDKSKASFELPLKKQKPIIGEVRGAQIDTIDKVKNSTPSCETLCKNCGNWFRSKTAQFGNAEIFKNAVIYSNREMCPYCKIVVRVDKKDMRFVERDENGKIVNEVRA